VNRVYSTEACQTSSYLPSLQQHRAATSNKLYCLVTKGKSIAHIPLGSSRLNTTRHVRRVERLETSVLSRAVRQTQHSQNALAPHVERVETWHDEPSGTWAYVSGFTKAVVARRYSWESNLRHIDHQADVTELSCNIIHGRIVQTSRKESAVLKG